MEHLAAPDFAKDEMLAAQVGAGMYGVHSGVDARITYLASFVGQKRPLFDKLAKSSIHLGSFTTGQLKFVVPFVAAAFDAP